MTTLLTIGYCCLFLMSVFMIGLYVFQERAIQDMKQTIHFLLNENREIRAKQRVFEKRFINLTKPETIRIVHERSDDSDLKFGGEGI